VLWRRANRDVANHDFSRAKFCVAFHMCGSAGNSPRARLLIGNFRPSTLYRRYGNAASSPPQPSETKAHVEIGGICSDRRRAPALGRGSNGRGREQGSGPTVEVLRESPCSPSPICSKPCPLLSTPPTPRGG